MIPWIRKYQPNDSSEVQAHTQAIKEIKDLITNFKKKKKKAMLLYGPSGNGKTSSVHAIASELNLEIIEVNASDFRNKDGINSLVGNAIGQQSLFFKSKIILVDEVDGISGKDDRGGINALTSLIAKTTFPIIITANNPFDKKFSTLRKKAELIEYKTLAYTDVFAVLKRICDKEKIKYDEIALKALARRAGGDLRAAITDLQILSNKSEKIDSDSVNELSQRLQQDSIHNALMKIFKSTDPYVAISALDNVNEDFDKVLLWIDQNLPKEYEKPEDLARAYEMLSRSDVFKGRIRRWQHYRFLVYINTLLTTGIAVSKDEKNKKFIKYEPTKRILKLWIAKQKNLKRKAIAEKIAHNTHSSTKEVIKNTLPYIQVMFKKDKELAEILSEEFELDCEEVAWLKK